MPTTAPRGDGNVEGLERQCKGCGETLPLAAFGVIKKHVTKDGRTRVYRRYLCDPCQRQKWVEDDPRCTGRGTKWGKGRSKSNASASASPETVSKYAWRQSSSLDESEEEKQARREREARRDRERERQIAEHGVQPTHTITTKDGKTLAFKGAALRPTLPEKRER